MPCVTGRAGHTLLKKDCQSGCACCVNSTYSCGILKCDEPLINTKKPDISGLVCEILKNLLEENPGSCGNLISGLAASLESLPEKYCRVRIERRNITQSTSGIAETEDREIITIVGDPDPSTNDVLTYFVNGVECLTCTD
jgi:hypothetical protein